MQGVHRVFTRRKVILPIMYHWSIDPCGDTAVLWRVQDTKHLGGHRVMHEAAWGGGVVGSQVSCFPKTIQPQTAGFIPICLVPSEWMADVVGYLT